MDAKSVLINRFIQDYENLQKEPANHKYTLGIATNVNMPDKDVHIIDTLIKYREPVQELL